MNGKQMKKIILAMFILGSMNHAVADIQLPQCNPTDSKSVIEYNPTCENSTQDELKRITFISGNSAKQKYDSLDSEATPDVNMNANGLNAQIKKSKNLNCGTYEAKSYLQDSTDLGPAGCIVYWCNIIEFCR